MRFILHHGIHKNHHWMFEDNMNTFSKPIPIVKIPSSAHRQNCVFRPYAQLRVVCRQNRFDGLWRRHQIYTSGEELIGLEHKEYPILGQIKKELNLLQKLYRWADAKLFPNCLSKMILFTLRSDSSFINLLVVIMVMSSHCRS